MRHPARHALIRLSLLLCLAALAALPLSFFRVVSLVRTNRQSSEVLQVVNGCVILHDQRGPGMVAFFGMSGQPPHTWSSGFDSAENDWRFALLPHYWELNPMTTASGTLTRRVLILPLWLLAGIFALPTILPVLKRRLRVRPGPGVCSTCGYDLRATPERCPECGAIPKKSQSFEPALGPETSQAHP